MKKIKKQKVKETNVEKFNRWMAEKIHSVYYPDHEKMCNAYERILKH